MATSNNKLIIILSAVLLAVITASMVLLFLLPSNDGQQAAPKEDLSPSATPAQEKATLDLKVYDRKEYKQLNSQPVKDGSVPVEPPAQVGKANPFL